ncbi:MAG: DUF6431 domain-containing protein [bacterium]|jgi:hypothetical protein
MSLPYYTESVNTYSLEEVVKVAEKAVCLLCRSKLGRHEWRRRIARLSPENREYIKVLRLHCSACKANYTILPTFLLPHKHYVCEVIENTHEELLAGVPAECTIPSHSTARRWFAWIKSIGPALVGGLKELLHRPGGDRVPDVPLRDVPLLQEIEDLLALLGVHIGGRLSRAMLVCRLC